MALSPTEQAAKDFLEDVNGDPYDAILNPKGMGDPGYLTNFEIYTSAIATYGNAIERESGDAITAAVTATNAADTAEDARDAAVVAKNAAEAAAASASFPFGVTNFTPDQPTSAGSAFRVQFHTGCGNNPTLSVDGATAANLVNQAGQNLQSGDIATNRIYMIIYDAALSKWAVNNFVANEVLRSDETAVLDAGYSTTSHNLGTITTGTVTPNETNGQFQHYVNGGAHTLAPPANDTVITMQITNNGSAGAITTSGFTRVTGDAFTTTNGHDFICDLRKINGFSQLNITAMQ